MWYKIHYIIFSSVIAFGFLAIAPSALAYTAQVSIIPGAGSSDHCLETNTCFTPSILTISPGDNVTWTNSDNVNHIVTSGMPYASQRGTIFDSGMIAPGKTFSFTFYNPGTYVYSDKVDRWMVGKVIVTSVSSPTVPEFGGTVTIIFAIMIVLSIVLSRNKITWFQ